MSNYISSNNNIINIKILQNTTYKLAQKEANNYMKNINMLGGEIIGTPQLILKRIPKNVIQKIHYKQNNKNKQQQRYLQQLPQKVYQKCLKLYSQQHPELHLDVQNTTMKALQFYGLKKVIKEIKQTQQKVITQYKATHNMNLLNEQISNYQYYTKITYKMSYRIYKNSKKYL